MTTTLAQSHLAKYWYDQSGLKESFQPGENVLAMLKSWERKWLAK